MTKYDEQPCATAVGKYVSVMRLLARWMDSTILNALYGWHTPHRNFNPLMGLNNAFADMLLNFVMATMFIVLPGFWMMALAWAGVRMGSALNGLTAGTADAKSAGGRENYRMGKVY